MHDNEVTIDEAGVRSLLNDQFPVWAGLPLAVVRSAGTDNTIWRLGDELALRFPRAEWAASQPLRDHQLLPLLNGLPLEVPKAVAVGEPGKGFPFHWSVQTWIPAELTSSETIRDRSEMARDLGRFVHDLRARPTDPVFVVEPEGPSRGGSLAVRDAETHAAIHELGDLFDTGHLLELWERALDAPLYDGAPCWLHGDLHAANLLARKGRLTAVIDWGAAGAGDPAPDMLPAWWIFEPSNRDAFIEATGSDQAMIDRGRGWALTIAVVALAYYRGGRNTVLADMSSAALSQVLAE